MSKRIILIDPGHGADTPGKRSPDGTLREYEFNRGVAKLLRDKLTSLNFDARLTVMDDVDMPLSKRTNQARDLKRQGYEVILISVHANASGNDWSPARGIETFTNDQAEDLAELIQQSLIQETGLKNRGLKRADLHITRESGRYGIPGALVELGFMTNHEEVALLKTATYREKCATAIAKAICEYTGVSFQVCSDKTPVPVGNSPMSVEKLCHIEINGKLLPVNGKNLNGVTRIPIRAVAEAVGVVPEWCPNTKQVRVGGHDLDETIEDDLSFAPSRQLAAALGMKIEWVGSTDTVKLTKI